mgnify:CR=1 FL=1
MVLDMNTFDDHLPAKLLLFFDIDKYSTHFFV